MKVQFKQCDETESVTLEGVQKLPEGRQFMATETEFFGINLGTTYSSVCFCQTPDKPEFLTDKTKTYFPSAISFSDDDGAFLFGDGAEKFPETSSARPSG